MPDLLERPTDDPTQRVTSEQLTQQSLAPDNPIDPLKSGTFQYDQQAPGLQPNPANKQSVFSDVRQGIKDKKAGVQPTNTQRNLEPEEIKGGFTPEDTANLNELMRLIREKRFTRALAFIASHPELRQKMRGAVEDLKRQIAIKKVKDQIKREIKAAVVDFLVATSEFWVPALVIILIILAFVIGYVALQHRPLDGSGNQLVLQDGSVIKSASNPDGIYLSSRIMTPTLAVPGKSGAGLNQRNRTLHLETTSGGYSNESPAVLTDKGWHIFEENTVKGQLYYNGALPASVTQKEMDYYVTARWPTQYGYNFDYTTHKEGTTMPGWGERNDYAGKKVVIYNVATKKAVVGIVAEWGPAPWTGVCSGANSKDTTTDNKFNKASCEDQRKTWNDRSFVTVPASGIKTKNASQLNLDYTPPANYAGRIAGGPPLLTNKLGIKKDGQDDRILIGFATNQSLAPGTEIPVSDSDIVHVVDTTTPVNGALNVPAVSEGEGGDCGDASINMAMLYYLSNRGTKIPEPADLPAPMKKHIVRVDSGERAVKGEYITSTTDGRGTCPSPSYTSDIHNDPKGGSVPDGWVKASGFTSADQLKMAINSVKGGDPVVYYSKVGGWFNNSHHIYLLTGYDDKTGEFIVNNPNVGHVEKAIKGTGDKKQTLQHLFDYRGDLDSEYNHTLMIRKQYCSGVLCSSS